MKTKYILFLTLIALAFLTSSCTKEDLVNPPKVVLNVDWANRSESVPIPSSYKVIVDDQTVTYREVSNVLPELIAGTYPVSIYNPVERITVNSSTATVNTTNGIIDTSPGWLFYSDLDVTYENDKEITVTAVMQQQVRLLNIELDITEGNANDITSIAASMSGVANMLHMKNGTHTGTGLKVIPVFTRTENKLTASVRLIGITSETQNLTLDITYNDGTKQQIISDISTKLTDFNIEKHKPVTLKGDTKIWSRVGFDTIITEWQIQDSITGDAEEQ
ncbi:MAG: FimB/Mfa2 family fimbrial subunit [Dysgonomonas sp.]|nr:FimB/Mfa2 family fimbrial subunit [Dysgonomonas sp.]